MRLILTVLVACITTASAELPKGFVYLDEVAPGLLVDIRYASSRNFVGETIDGYKAPRAILTEQAAAAIIEIQNSLAPFKLGLKIFDAYRPQRAVNHFVRWARILPDTGLTKGEYYPHVAKNELFDKFYIAARSSHSRGSTVDVTLVSLDDPDFPEELDMGGKFDFFDPISAPAAPEITPQQRANRAFLQFTMRSHGFLPYAQEWWHFTLKNEPFPDTYHDFPVE